MKCTFEPVFNLLLCIAVSNEFGFESCLHLKEQKLKTPSSLKSPFAHSIFLLSTCNVGLKTWKNKEKQGLLNPLDTPICNSNSNHFNIPEFLRLEQSAIGIAGQTQYVKDSFFVPKLHILEKLEKWPIFIFVSKLTLLAVKKLEIFEFSRLNRSIIVIS